MQKLWLLLNSKILPALLLFFLVFIPLYPKLPILDIFGTWVYIRIEDFLVAIAVVLLGIVFIRHRDVAKTPLTKPILIFWIVGLLSTVIAILFIFPQLQGAYPHIAFLHFARRIEYMILFFLSFAVMSRQKKILPWLVTAMVVTGLAIFFYGLGQKYAGFPAFSTMNEEFAKGVPLRLPPTARIMSTFAGHYDLAAYLVLTIPIFGSVFFALKKWWLKLILLFTAVSSFILLLLTASRVSFGVYLLTVTLMLWFQKKRLLIVPVIIASVIMVNFVSGASDRFLKTLRFNDVVVDLSTGQPIGTLEKVEGGKAVLERISEPDEENLPKGSSFIGVPTAPAPENQDAIETIEYIKKKDLTAAVGDVATVSGSFLIQRAFVLDISITTRFQGQWPRAMAAFQRNIMTGSGYSSLSLAADGNFHRMLGETGILGTVAFLGIFIYAGYWFLRKKDQLEGLEKAFVIGLFAGIGGLFANALLIDVFEASKVAFPLWMLLGVAMAILVKHRINHDYQTILYRFFTHKLAWITYLAVAIILLFQSMLPSYFIGDDFTWLRWAAELTTDKIPQLFIDSQGFFYRPIPKLWYYVLFAVFWLKPHAYHLASLGLFVGIAIGVYYLLRSLKLKTALSGFLTVAFAVLAVHHENIFWISGQSSLLAVFFLLMSMILATMQVKKPFQKVLPVLSILSLLAAMGSWESMIVAPLLFIWFVYRETKQKRVFVLLGLIPFYLWIRAFSGAVPASGDYAYNLGKIVVNSLGNGLTYVLSVAVGPKAMEYSHVIRQVLKSYASTLTVVAVVLAVLSGVGLWVTRRRWKLSSDWIFVAGSLLISLAPFLGLGAASERYALLPSVFVIMGVGLLIGFIWRRTNNIIIKALPIVAVLALMWWNVTEVKRVGEEWSVSGKVTQQSLLAIRKGFFPPPRPLAFVFVDTPIRYGRAWIYPTGLHDALWHMYRQSPFTTTQVDSITQAFEYPPLKDYEPVILQFEQYQLKQVVKEVIPQSEVK